MDYYCVFTIVMFSPLLMYMKGGRNEANKTRKQELIATKIKSLKSDHYCFPEKYNIGEGRQITITVSAIS